MIARISAGSESARAKVLKGTPSVGSVTMKASELVSTSWTRCILSSSTKTARVAASRTSSRCGVAAVSARMVTSRSRIVS